MAGQRDLGLIAWGMGRPYHRVAFTTRSRPAFGRHPGRPPRPVARPVRTLRSGPTAATARQGICLDGLLIIPVLAILIIAHELGHYWAARSVGVKVEEFGIGIPPRAKGWERNGVIWSLNWIPFGGFVRVKGEDAGDMSPDSMNSKPPLQRAFFLIAGSFMNVVLALVLIIALVGFVGVIHDRVYVQSVVPGAPAAIAGLLPDDRIVRANGEPVDDSTELISVINDNRGDPVELTVQRGTQEMVLTVTPREDPPAGQGATGMGLNSIAEATIDVGSVDAGGPAATAGLLSGDRLTAIDGVPVTDSIVLDQTLRAAQARTVTLTIERAGQLVDLPVALPFPGIAVTQVNVDSAAWLAGVRPGDALLALGGTQLLTAETFGEALRAARQTTLPVTVSRPTAAVDDPAARTGQFDLSLTVPAFDDTGDYLGALGIQAAAPPVTQLLGTSLDLEPVYTDVAAADVIPTGVSDAWDQISGTVEGLRQLLTGEQSLSNLAGPVGMGQLTGEVLDRSAESPWISLTKIMITLSFSLAILNLLPLPALDGGRLLFVIIEMVRGGRKIAPEKEGVVHFAGLVLLLGVMFVVAFNDIRRIFEGNSFLN